MKTAEYNLTGKRVAILATDGFEQDELLSPMGALKDAGADAQVVSPSEEKKIKGWKDADWGKKVKVDLPLKQADSEDFDALVLPGGVMNPDHLRRDPHVLAFVKAFFNAGKPVGAICHGPWTLIDAGVVSGRKMTSYETIQSDLKNAGAQWVDQEVVVDNGLVTSRKPDDLPAFNAKLIEEIAEGVHPRQSGKIVSRSAGNLTSILRGVLQPVQCGTRKLPVLKRINCRELPGQHNQPEHELVAAPWNIYASTTAVQEKRPVSHRLVPSGAIVSPARATRRSPPAVCPAHKSSK